MSNAIMMNVEDRHVIFTHGKVDKHIYKILSGKVGLYHNYGTSEEKLIGITSAPHYIGTMSAFSYQPSTYTAVTLTKAMLLKLPESEWSTFVKSDPGSAVSLIKAMAHQLMEENEELKMLLGELKELSMDTKLDRRAVQSLVERYDAIIDTDPILDEYEEYIPVPEQGAGVDPTLPAFLKNVSDLYLPGHKGYPGITHPEYAQYLLSVEYTCPHCRKIFRGSKILVSQLVPVRKREENFRYDLRVFYRDFETEWYEIITCPHCSFSSFEHYFTEGKSLYQSRYESKMAHFRDSVPMDFSGERDLDFVFAQHYLALICARGFQEWRQIMARVWMNLIQLYESVKDEKLVRAAEERAVEAYQTVYTECDLQPGQERRLCLTVAGMLYARGEKKEARLWATRVRVGYGDQSAYWNLAEQLIQDVRAELEAEKES